MDAQTTDVVIVGAGPTGLTAAHLCARVGLSSIVLERRSGPQRAPAAHAVNARSFEIWRQAGVPMDPLLDAAANPTDAGRVFWMRKLGDDVIGSLPYERQGDEMYDITPTPLRNLSQHKLEPLLRPADGDVRYEHAWVGATETDDGVTVEVEGPDGPYSIVATYLLGADGAGSPVRRSVGIEPIGPRNIQSFVMVQIAGDLGSIVGDHRGVLYFLVDPHNAGVFVAHDIDREWVYMYTWDPELETPEDFTEQRCRDIVRGAMIDPGTEFEIVGTSTWHMTAQIAERYRHGRIFLVGDAAHRFPPTGGLGLNTGVGDAHNLVWKLAAVESGWAEPGLLDTYETERRPVAQFNADQSLHNAFKMVEIPAALGTTDDVEASTIAMNERLTDPVQRAAVEAAIANQAIHFDLLGLQLGHCYEAGAIVPDGTGAPELDEPARDYVPSTRPGGRLPHAWLDETTSTLDLIDIAAPTVLYCDGESAPATGPLSPAVTVACDRAIWLDTFDLRPDQCVIVRPDQHIAFRGPALEVDGVLNQLFSGERSTA